MKKRIQKLGLSLAILLAPVMANAALIELTATNDGPTGTNGAFSGFSLVFNDTGDGLLQLDELVSFSGIDELGGSMRQYVEITGTPEVSGVSTQSGYTESGSGAFWWLRTASSSNDDGWFAARWTYEVSSVPAPGTLLLLGLGLAGLAVRRRAH